MCVIYILQPAATIINHLPRGYAIDITEQKAFERKLLESEECYKALLETFDGPVYICDQYKKVRYMNSKALARSGSGMIGMPCHKAIHDMEDNCPWCKSEQVLSGTKVRFEVKSPKDKRLYEIKYMPVRLSDGAMMNMALLHEVTNQESPNEWVSS